MTAFRRINLLISLANIARQQGNQTLIANTQAAIRQYKSNGKNKTKSHPKPRTHMILVRAARTKYNKAKN